MSRGRRSPAATGEQGRHEDLRGREGSRGGPGIPPSALPRRNEAHAWRAGAGRGFAPAEIHEPRRFQPLTVYTRRVCRASIVKVEEAHVELDSSLGGEASVVEDPTNNVDLTALRH